jgi:hypothetical protein
MFGANSLITGTFGMLAEKCENNLCNWKIMFLLLGLIQGWHLFVCVLVSALVRNKKSFVVNICLFIIETIIV